MPRRACWLLLIAACCSIGSSHAANKPPQVFVIDRPTLIAFFPITQAQLDRDSDAGEGLSDFQFYAGGMRKKLVKAGIDFHEVYDHSFTLVIGPQRVVFRPKGGRPGYYLIAPGRPPQVEYSIMTDEDMYPIASKYFGIPISD